MSQSPEAYERLILDAMRGDATLFTRNDEVDRAVVDHRPDPAGLARRARRRRCTTYESGSAGPGGGRRADRRGPPLARALADGRRSGASATRRPARIEAALRDMFAERHKEERAFVPARVMNLVVIVDARVPRRDREPARSASAATTRRGSCCARSRTGRDDARRVGGDRHRRRAAARATIAVGARARRAARSASGTCAKLDTIVDPLLVRDLATMVWAPHGHDEAVDALRRLAQIVLIDSQDEPDVERRAGPRAHDLVRRHRTSSTSPGCARRRGASASRPRSTRRAGAPELRRDRRRHRAPPRGLARRRRCCSAAGCPRGWAGSRARSRTARGRWSGHARTRRQDVRIQLEPVDMNPPGLAGVTIEIASGAAVSLDRAPGGLRGVRRDARRHRAARGPCWAPRAARAASSARASARRCCAIPTYRPALAVRAEVMVA